VGEGAWPTPPLNPPLPASEAYVERVISVCGELTAGKRNRLTKSHEKRIMLKMNVKYYMHDSA